MKIYCEYCGTEHVYDTLKPTKCNNCGNSINKDSPPNSSSQNSASISPINTQLLQKLIPPMNSIFISWDFNALKEQLIYSSDFKIFGTITINIGSIGLEYHISIDNYPHTIVLTHPNYSIFNIMLDGALYATMEEHIVQEQVKLRTLQNELKMTTELEHFARKKTLYEKVSDNTQAKLSMLKSEEIPANIKGSTIYNLNIKNMEADFIHLLAMTTYVLHRFR